MVNEAVKVELTNETGFPRRFTVASGVTIDKGSLLGLLDNRTASAGALEEAPCAGIASMDKDNTDFSTSITAWTDGIFIMTASNAIVTGSPVMAEGHDNEVMVVSSGGATASGARTIGYAMEDIADEGTGAIRIRL